MKRFVRSEAGLAYAFGAIGGLIVGVTHAGPGTAYLIALGLSAIGLAIILGPDRLDLWRERHPTKRR